MENRKGRSIILYLLIFISGFAGLGYEMIWTRMLSTGLGHEYVAALAVVGAFFLGMAGGSGSLDRVISRSERPGRWYAWMELLIGVWSLLLILFIPFANRLSLYLIGPEPSLLRHWSVAFMVPFILLLPATFAMGATLPAVERFISGLKGDGWTISGIYASNTFGGVAGTIVATFFLAPSLGFRNTLLLMALINFICATGIFLIAGQNKNHRPPLPLALDTGSKSLCRPLIILFFTGLLGIGYEVLVVRVLSQIFENTVYSFAGMLSVYLLGTSAGAALYQWFARRDRFNEMLIHLMHLTSFFCLLGLLVIQHIETITPVISSISGKGMSGAVTGEMLTAFIIFFLPTMAMGALFSHLAQGVRREKSGIGWALGINTLGSSIAPFLFGTILLTAVGVKISLLIISAGYLILAPFKHWKRWSPVIIPLGLIYILITDTNNFHFLEIPPNCRVVEYKEGVMASVAVLEDSNKDYYLKVNNKFVMGSTASVYSDLRQANIPLLLHPAPKKALFLGLGTGATFSACADHPDLKAVGIELIPEVVEVLPCFKKATGDFASYPQLQIKVADARRYVRTASDKYDVILADLFHPARDGAGSLYTVEHFKAIRNRLDDNGIFCQWLPLYQLDLDVLKIIIRSYLNVFPDGSAYLAHYSLATPMIGLVSAKGPMIFQEDWMSKRVSLPEMKRLLSNIRLKDTYEFFGCFIASSKGLKKFAGQGPLNTDNLPVVIFKAPRFTYTNTEPAYTRLLKLIDSFDPVPEQVLGPITSEKDIEVNNRLKAYWLARNKFLHAGAGVEQTNDLEAMLKIIRKPLLEVVEISPDFDAAYLPLLSMARQLYAYSPEMAIELLSDLEKACPGRLEARLFRKQLLQKNN